MSSPPPSSLHSCHTFRLQVSTSLPQTPEGADHDLWPVSRLLYCGYVHFTSLILSSMSLLSVREQANQCHCSAYRSLRTMGNSILLSTAIRQICQGAGWSFLVNLFLALRKLLSRKCAICMTAKAARARQQEIHKQGPFSFLTDPFQTKACLLCNV